ncbi:PREDICTED: uncharacterized protein LOC102258614 isoform X6 [Myotis brandtii]|uniref:uncharacterized protein LOC102258614 isoform X6 n=1 Tax=Myotis brandtii TaxID=109478 RepID=UPI00070410CC|nr:PREDICTED: uncharacterized protein LOC102258614 isoform X6 [Myotis brandtii]
MHFRVRPEAQPLSPPHTHPPPQARTLAVAAHLGPSEGLPERPCEYRDGAGTELASPESVVCRIGDLRPLPVREGEHGRAGGEAPGNPDGGLCAGLSPSSRDYHQGRERRFRASGRPIPGK